MLRSTLERGTASNNLTSFLFLDDNREEGIVQRDDNPSRHHRRRVGTLVLIDGFKLTFFDRPGGLVALKTLREASTPNRPIEAYLFEAYAHFRLILSREVLSVF